MLTIVAQCTAVQLIDDMKPPTYEKRAVYTFAVNGEAFGSLSVTAPLDSFTVGQWYNVGVQAQS